MWLGVQSAVLRGAPVLLDTAVQWRCLCLSHVKVATSGKLWRAGSVYRLEETSNAYRHWLVLGGGCSWLRIVPSSGLWYGSVELLLFCCRSAGFVIVGFSSRYCDLAMGQKAGGQGLRSAWGRRKGRTQPCVQLVSGALSHGHDDGHYLHLLQKLIWHSEDRASWYIVLIKPTKCTNFSNLFLE
jgi:hypothetical protein